MFPDAPDWWIIRTQYISVKNKTKHVLVLSTDASLIVIIEMILTWKWNVSSAHAYMYTSKSRIKRTFMYFYFIILYIVQSGPKVWVKTSHLFLFHQWTNTIQFGLIILVKDDLVWETQAIHISHSWNPVSAFFSCNEDLFIQMDVFILTSCDSLMVLL